MEFIIALAAGSVALFAASVDFLEDAAINLLVFLALAWTPRARARLGMGLAGLLLIPGLATLWMAWAKFSAPAAAPDSRLLTLTRLAALAVNLTAAFILAGARRRGDSLTQAALNADAVRKVRDAALKDHEATA